jgi:hypothetical protein
MIFLQSIVVLDDNNLLGRKILAVGEGTIYIDKIKA